MSPKRRQITDADRRCHACRQLSGHIVGTGGWNTLYFRCRTCGNKWGRYERVTPELRAQHERDVLATKARRQAAAERKASRLSVAVREQREHMALNGYEDPQDDDALDILMGDCGRLPDGSCMQAGTEYCDWDCPFSRVS